MFNNQQTIPLALLETLVIFSREKTTAKTAQILGLTQPTVSRQLVQLEEALPQAIFRMQGRNKVLTDYGHAIAKESEKHLSQMNKALGQINQNYLAPEQLKITIAGRQEILAAYLDQFDFPGTIELIPLGTKEVVARLQSQTIDVAITHDLSFTSDYIRKKFFTSSVKIIIPKKWFPQKPTLPQWLSQAHKYPVAHYQGSYSHLDHFIEHFKIENKLTCSLISQHWPLIEKRTVLNKSWAIIPSSFINDKSNYYILDLPSEFEEQIFYLVYRKEYQKQEWFKKFLASLKL